MHQNVCIIITQPTTTTNKSSEEDEEEVKGHGPTKMRRYRILELDNKEKKVTSTTSMIKINKTREE
eukprot:m.13752 g.13752  ORF g.13752 m.13752 type:complete len:66 (+) comp4192_c0_seq1:1486-1683(+)